MKHFYLLTAFLILLFSSQAQDPKSFGMVEKDLPIGLAVGDTAPDFLGYTLNGEAFQLSENLGSGPLVLIFYRGEWCPICTRYLQNWADSVELILDLKGDVIFVSPELPDYAEETQAKVEGNLNLISDTSLYIGKAYDVYFEVTSDYEDKVMRMLGTSLQDQQGSETPLLPVPATYLIDQNGIIQYRQFDYNYSNRASVADVLNALEKLK